MNLLNLETPCLVLDRQKVKKNIASLHHRMQRLGVNLRPHGKTAKSIDVMRMALEGQGGGITVSTLKEAEYYFSHGVVDIVYAVGITPIKLSRITTLVKNGAKITIVLDSIEQVSFVVEKCKEYGITIPVLIEIDCDGHRSGVTNDDPSLLEIARLLDDEVGVVLSGILTHAGESYNCKSVNEIRQLAEVERSTAVKCAEILRQDGLPCPVVSVGSTPTANFAEDLAGITEVRAGVFVFYDLVMAGLGVCDIEDVGISVLTSVIGHQKKKGWVITDAGWMALSRDRGTSRQKIDFGYGQVCDQDGTPLAGMLVSSSNQEHGIIESSGEEGGDLGAFEIGRVLRVLPNHACATGAMHDRYYVTDGATNGRTEIVDVWHRVNGW
jgi:D-serine deaminase-like pyridoxal phosphate-dependent protein